jgi:hypothetical protein
MKRRIAYATAAVAAVGCIAFAQNQSASVTTPPMHMSRRADPSEVRSIISNWMAEPKMNAEKMIRKYGQPNEATDTQITWWHNGPWKWTKIENVEIPHDFPMPHHDMMQQAINWRVSPSMFDALAKYDGSVIVERTRGEVSARCDKEEANFLALNLAHDIVTNRRNVQQARAFYAQTIKQMKAMRLDAQHRPYVKGFIFNPSMRDQNDRDMPHR